MEGREENIMNNTQIDDEDSNARQGSGKTERGGQGYTCWSVGVETGESNGMKE